VFKRAAAPAAAAVYPATGTAGAALGPASPEGMPPPGSGDPAAPPPGRGFPAPAPGTPVGSSAAPPLPGASDRSGANDMGLPKAAAPGPATVIYRAKVAAAETLEKVAVDLAKSRRRGAVTAIADPRTGSLILTGEAAAIREIVERLERLEAELGDAKPLPASGTRP
jgi:hypothetical protein